MEKSPNRTSGTLAPQPGELFLAKVGADKVRPVLIVGCGCRKYRYLECTTVRHVRETQCIIEGYGLEKRGYLNLCAVYEGDLCELRRRIGRVDREFMEFIDFKSITARYPVRKNPLMYSPDYRRFT